MLNIDQLKYNWKKPFYKLMKEMKMRRCMVNPDIIVIHNDDICYFEYNEKTNEFWFANYHITINKLKKIYPLKDREIEIYIKTLIEEYYNLPRLKIVS